MMSYLICTMLANPLKEKNGHRYISISNLPITATHVYTVYTGNLRLHEQEIKCDENVYKALNS